MNKKLKQILIVLPICFIFAVLAILSSLLDYSFVANFYRISSMVILTLWSFFITPTVMFAIGWIKDACERATLNQAFRGGARVGVCLGGIVILCILASPVIGTIWFVQTIKEISSTEKENKKNAANSTENNDIFNID